MTIALPEAAPIAPAALAELADLVSRGGVVALTGAGLSTESGIPDYRGEGTRRRARAPVQFKQYIRSPDSRRKYWARALIGWESFVAARPNAAHHAVAALERRGLVNGVITQNVDRLHQGAGSAAVIELHGALHDVRCLDCGAHEDRAELQARLLAMNPGFRDLSAAPTPDGDAEVEDARVAAFQVAACRFCAGTLKPDVVFFGESVPRPRVEQAYRWVEEARAILVLGSSLAVLSGFRFVRKAHALGIPVAVVNLGPTRGDALAHLKIEGRLGTALPQLLESLAPPVPEGSGELSPIRGWRT